VRILRSELQLYTYVAELIIIARGSNLRTVRPSLKLRALNFLRFHERCKLSSLPIRYNCLPFHGCLSRFIKFRVKSIALANSAKCTHQDRPRIMGKELKYVSCISLSLSLRDFQPRLSYARGCKFAAVVLLEADVLGTSNSDLSHGMSTIYRPDILASLDWQELNLLWHPIYPRINVLPGPYVEIISRPISRRWFFLRLVLSKTANRSSSIRYIKYQLLSHYKYISK